MSGKLRETCVKINAYFSFRLAPVNTLAVCFTKRLIFQHCRMLIKAQPFTVFHQPKKKKKNLPGRPFQTLEKVYLFICQEHFSRHIPKRFLNLHFN